MTIKRLYILTGYLSVLAGVISVMGIARIKWLYTASGIGAVGILFALINIIISTRYFADSEKMPKGYFGLFLSALPIVFLILVFKVK